MRSTHDGKRPVTLLARYSLRIPIEGLNDTSRLNCALPQVGHSADEISSDGKVIYVAGLLGWGVLEASKSLPANLPN